LCASRSTQTADLFGSYFKSNISACSNICSNNSGIPCHVLDEIQITGTSHHRSSAVNQYFAISDFIWSMFCPGLSILVIATIIGTPAAFACHIDSIV